MQIAILGAGQVGRALASRFAAAGAAVRFGVRDAAGRTEAGGLADVRPLREAASGADLVVVAVPAAAAAEAVRAAVGSAPAVVLDCTNPIRWDGGPVWAPPAEGSVAQALARAFPACTVIKGFNHFGAEVQARPEHPTGPADAFFASDDATAKARVMELATRMGFVARDAGPLRNAALLENLAILWIHLATVGGLGRRFAFRCEPLVP